MRVTFNPNAEIESGNVGRAGGGGGLRGGGIALGGGSGCIFLIVLVIWTLLGGNPLALLGGASGPEQQSGPASSLEECQTGADANSNDDCLVQATIESADSLWATAGPEAGISFQEPTGELFRDQVSTGCGAATSQTGPFYCPADQTIYIDTAFFDSLQSTFGASGGQLAKEYVVAHEYGHHIQRLEGTMSQIDRGDLGPQGDQVRLELQADCYAGMWAHHASSTTDDNGNAMLEPLTEQQIQDALSAASAVGDDNIQENVSGGQSTPETWTHGSSEQRMHWFTVGYNEGTVQACDTFGAEQV